MTASPSPTKTAIFFRRGLSTLTLWGTVIAVFMSKHPVAYLALIAILAFGASWEYAQMLSAARVPMHKRLFLLISLLYLTLHSLTFLMDRGNPDMSPSILRALIDIGALIILTLGAFCLQLRQPIDGLSSLQSIAFTVFGWVAIPFLFSFCAKILFMSNSFSTMIPQLPGAFVLLWLIAVTKFTDMGAYLTGSLIGKHKMIPHISPGKTWEGFAGAMLFALLAGCGLYAWLPNTAGLAILGTWPCVILLSLVIAVASVVGDLAESLVKRCLSAKDSGSLLPGIGGFYDLVDSLCFTAPVLCISFILLRLFVG